MTTASAPLTAFQWQPQPAAEALVHRLVQEFLEHCPAAALLAQRMHDDTGTRFFDWIDSLTLPANPATAAHFLDVGFLENPPAIFHHPQGIFPRILLAADSGMHVAIKVDSVADFLTVNQVECPVEGEPFAPSRRAAIAQNGDFHLDIIERRGSAEFTPPPRSDEIAINAAHHLERFRFRRREFDDESHGFRHTAALVHRAIEDLGPDQTCSLFFTAEREFWQSKNHAAQVQKARQDRLGLGWANHDHHTYRSSRAYFHLLIALFEKLGLTCRERFYAGREAGWGAQVMENLNANIVVFADVDLAPEELLEDFAHRPLAPRQELGTVGLWCGLHGEAILQAGMHHLECQFDFAAFKTQLESQHHVAVMKPFTNFPHLKQAFTEGERWPVSPQRLEKLVAAKLITPEQARQFETQGAIGSHLENLERNAGYKGFNQTGVSQIIAATDPRRNLQKQNP